MLDAFKTNGSSPPKRYRLKVATWTVVREPGQLALSCRLSQPEAVAEVFGPALREGAAAIVLAHNHPSGDPTPSREDLRLTRQLADAGKLLDTRVHDHVVIGNGTWQWVSLAQRGLV